MRAGVDEGGTSSMWGWWAVVNVCIGNICLQYVCIIKHEGSLYKIQRATYIRSEYNLIDVVRKHRTC